MRYSSTYVLVFSSVLSMRLTMIILVRYYGLISHTSSTITGMRGAAGEH